MIGVFDNDGQQAPIIKPALEQYGIEIYNTKQQLVNHISSSKDGYAVCSPDTLVNLFTSRNIDYVVVASLRAIPSQKTERTINAIARYLYFIEQKYPGLFQKIQQFGKDNDEPASLYQINYQRYPNLLEAKRQAALEKKKKSE